MSEAYLNEWIRSRIRSTHQAEEEEEEGHGEVKGNPVATKERSPAGSFPTAIQGSPEPHA